MRVFHWIWRGLLFVLFFAFALKNQQLVTLNGFAQSQWQAPMVVVVVAAFIVGSLTGALAMLPALLRQRRLSKDKPANAGKATLAPSTESPETLPATFISQIPPPPDVAAPRKRL
jgi:lipopolysaccharide assembly protein A